MDIKSMYRAGHSLKTLSRMTGLPIPTIRKVLVDEGVNIRPPGNQVSLSVMDRKVQARQMYAEGRTMQYIADVFGVSVSTIYRYLGNTNTRNRRWSVASNKAERKKRNQKLLKDFRRGKTYDELAKSHGITQSRVGQIIRSEIALEKSKDKARKE